jgi:hypothetical protein
MYYHILVQFPNIKFHENPFNSFFNSFMCAERHGRVKQANFETLHCEQAKNFVVEG